MVEQDRPKFAGLMASLSEIFDDAKDVSEIKMQIYWEALKEFSIKNIQQAISDVIRTRTYNSFPKPAEIRESLSGSKETLGLQAWLKVSWAIEHVGQYESVKFADPVIHSAIEAMGGWIDLCQKTLSKDMVWKQKEFERLYQILSTHDTNHPKYLCGLVETENGGLYADFTPKPVLIDNRMLAVGSSDIKGIEGESG